MVFLWKTAFEKTRKNVVKYFLQTQGENLPAHWYGRLPAPAGHAAAGRSLSGQDARAGSAYIPLPQAGPAGTALSGVVAIPLCAELSAAVQGNQLQGAAEKKQLQKLNLMDKDYYETAEKLLSEEFALALQTTPDAMREQLHTAALA